jgi:hypothetical protein
MVLAGSLRVKQGSAAVLMTGVPRDDALVENTAVSVPRLDVATEQSPSVPRRLETMAKFVQERLRLAQLHDAVECLRSRASHASSTG